MWSWSNFLGCKKPYKLQLVGLELGGKPIEEYAPDFWLVSSEGGGDPVGFITSPWFHPEKLNSIEVEGVSGGGLVKVTATAKGEIKRILLDESLLKKEDKEMTEDLIVAAINDAKQKGETASQEEMKSLTGGLPLPPGMKLPF